MSEFHSKYSFPYNKDIHTIFELEDEKGVLRSLDVVFKVEKETDYVESLYDVSAVYYDEDGNSVEVYDESVKLDSMIDDACWDQWGIEVDKVLALEEDNWDNARNSMLELD